MHLAADNSAFWAHIANAAPVPASDPLQSPAASPFPPPLSIPSRKPAADLVPAPLSLRSSALVGNPVPAPLSIPQRKVQPPPAVRRAAEAPSLAASVALNPRGLLQVFRGLEKAQQREGEIEALVGRFASTSVGELSDEEIEEQSFTVPSVAAAAPVVPAAPVAAVRTVGPVAPVVALQA